MDDLEALSGLTVVDLSQGIAGPYCAALLGELGARVIKVEPPGGDWARRAGGKVGSSSAIFETFNRGKLSVEIDLKHAGGPADVLRLVDAADVVVENARVGTMSRFGLDYAALAPGRPGLVYTSISGFGRAGPYAGHPATDTAMQAFTGLAVHATHGHGPQRLRIAFVDVASGLYASQATLAALMRRTRTGIGGLVDVSLAHSMAALQAYKIADVLANGPSGDAEAFAIAGNYESLDGPIAISVASDSQMCVALRALDADALLDDERFSTPASRQANQSALRGSLARMLGRMSSSQIKRRLDEAGVPCQSVLDYGGFVNHEQVRALGLFEWFETAEGVSMPGVRPPGLPAAARSSRRAPALNEHGAQLRQQFHLENR